MVVEENSEGVADANLTNWHELNCNFQTGEIHYTPLLLLQLQRKRIRVVVL